MKKIFINSLLYTAVSSFGILSLLIIINLNKKWVYIIPLGCMMFGGIVFNSILRRKQNTDRWASLDFIVSAIIILAVIIAVPVIGLLFLLR
jgi:uncharacterized membrane protein